MNSQHMGLHDKNLYKIKQVKIPAQIGEELRKFHSLTQVILELMSSEGAKVSFVHSCGLWAATVLYLLRLVDGPIPMQKLEYLVGFFDWNYLKMKYMLTKWTQWASKRECWSCEEKLVLEKNEGERMVVRFFSKKKHCLDLWNYLTMKTFQTVLLLNCMGMYISPGLCIYITFIWYLWRWEEMLFGLLLELQAAMWYPL